MKTTKKIKIDQIDSKFLKTAETFRCSFNSSHLIEDPIICPKCQQILCKSCYFFWGSCKTCGSLIDTNNSFLPISVKTLLDKIYLKCENFKNGCLVEIDYENYRNHTKNCKFQEIRILTDEEKQKWNLNASEIQNNPNLTKNHFFEKNNSNIENDENPKFLTNDKNEKKNTISLDSDPEINNSPENEESPKNFNDFQFEFKDKTLLSLRNSDFELLTIKQLKNILGERQISRNGNKAELINKVQMYVDILKNKQTQNSDNLNNFIQFVSNKNNENIKEGSKKIRKYGKFTKKTLELIHRNNL